MEENNGGFHIDKSSVDCNFCRCGKKALYKETKTTTDKEGNVVVNQVENRSSWKMGRNTTPDGNAIFKTNVNNKEDIETVSTGWGQTGTSRSITPEETEKRLEALEKEIEELKKRKLNSMD